MVVVQRSSAVRSLYVLLLIVHARINIVPTIRVRVRVVIWWAGRLPPKRVVHVRAVDPIVGLLLLLAIRSRWFKDLWRIVPR